MADSKHDGSQALTRTSVPIILTSKGQLAHVLDLSSLTSEGSVTLKPIVETGDSSCTSNFSVHFENSNECSSDMLSSSLTNIKPAMTLLQRIDALTSVASSSIASTLPETTTVFSLQSDCLQLSQELQDRAAVGPKMLVHPQISSSDPVALNKTSAEISSLGASCKKIQKTEKELAADRTKTNKAALSVCSATVPLVVKLEDDTSSVTHSLGVTDCVESLELEVSSAVDKSIVPPAAFFTEGAVLVETPQGLMLSVGDELRAVTLTEGSDSQGNHLLSISNSGIPVALISECQQEGLMDEQAAEEAYEGGEGNGTVEEPDVSSADLLSGQGLTISSPDDEEPRKKNRGWPKGKKRKIPAEVTGPRAPMTGYVLYAISRRQEIKQKHPCLPFTEITKILGQEWSTMSLDKKQKYLDEADNDKQRYIDELKEFQKSDAYQNILKRKRFKGYDEAGDDVVEETDDDGDELHCKVCKLYFSSLHNKKEHLLGRQHLNAIREHLKQELKRQQKEQEVDMRGDALVSLDMQFSHLGGSTTMSLKALAGEDLGECERCRCEKKRPVDISGFIDDFVHKNAERDQEILTLKRLYQNDIQENWQMCKQIEVLKNYESKLRQDIKKLTSQSTILNYRISRLKMVPNYFGVDVK